MTIEQSDVMSPRETMEHEWRLEEFKKQSEHQVAIRQLELEVDRENNKSMIEVKKLEAQFSSWLKIPILLIKLPLFILLGFAYICSMFTKKEMPKRFWDLLS